MAKTYEIKKKKKIKSWLSKTMYRVVLPCYAALVMIFGVTLIVISAMNMGNTATEIVLFVALGLLIAVSLTVIFVVIPLCRAKQAMFDFENYDFSPYAPQETETFSQTVQTEKYYFTPSPFDDDEGFITLANGEASEDFFSQFSIDRLKCVEELRANGEFIPFNIFDFTDDYFEGVVEKRREGEYVTVTVTEKPTVTFASDGVHLGDKVYSYEQCEAHVFAGFIQLYARVSASVTVVLSDTCAVSFAFGTRIMSIIDKYKIAVTDRDIADFILSDPKLAFRKAGLRGKLKKSKK